MYVVILVYTATLQGSRRPCICMQLRAQPLSQTNWVCDLG